MNIGKFRELFEIEVQRRRENSTYMQLLCDGSTPLGMTHQPKGFRRSDCIVCNGENNQVRFITWEDWIRATMNE